MTKLSKLHEQVKNHPFRVTLDKKDFSDYENLLRDFIREASEEYKKFNESVGDTAYEFLPSYHDFNMSKSVIFYKLKNGGDFGTYLSYIEMFISQIHYYITTGTFNTLVCGHNNSGLHSEMIYLDKYKKWFYKFRSVRELEEQKTIAVERKYSLEYLERLDIISNDLVVDGKIDWMKGQVYVKEEE